SGCGGQRVGLLRGVGVAVGLARELADLEHLGIPPKRGGIPYEEW
ncbi:MAG: hypothetical protein JF631_15005, partial [Mycobacterium sp.]|nr:hypothetical protein [Mycobacterium sp.]